MMYYNADHVCKWIEVGVDNQLTFTILNPVLFLAHVTIWHQVPVKGSKVKLFNQILLTWRCFLICMNKEFFKHI